MEKLTGQEKMEKSERLARDILSLARNTLLVNLRFLDTALSMFSWQSIDKDELSTDGGHMFYGVRHVLRRFRTNRALPVHDYLHMVFHCIFRHMFVSTLIDRQYWNLACDIAVEYSISMLGLKCTETGIEDRRKPVYDYLLEKTGQLTAEKIYRHYLDLKPDIDQLAELRVLFYSDNHDIWYMTDAEKAAEYGTDSSSSPDADESQPVISAGISSTELSEIWKGISEHVQMSIETFGKLKGDHPGGLIQNLKSVNRERYDYESFLKKFAVMGEAMKINDDEFDYIFYTYGLRLYGKVPLVEPLEYKEVRRIREFVIAIDTSGSTSGELVQKFMQKTYNILKSSESFFSKINIHIVQCDAAVQEDSKITCQDDFDAYLETMRIHGLGGTDFRPVFSYVDQLVKAGEFTNLKGLIYLTDGYGNFPARKPDYETAFVFIDNECNNPDIPPWAIKLVLPEDEI